MVLNFERIAAELVLTRHRPFNHYLTVRMHLPIHSLHAPQIGVLRCHGYRDGNHGLEKRLQLVGDQSRWNHEGAVHCHFHASPYVYVQLH